MNLRDIGFKYDHKQATVWINPANNPMMVDIIRTKLGRIEPIDKEAETTRDHTINNVRGWFIICEGYILDIDFKLNTTLKTYMESREPLGIEQRWHAFLMMVSRDDCDILSEAFEASRPTQIAESEQDEAKKKPASSTSPASTDATAKAQAAN